jgi:putative MFS transporter
MSKINTAEVSRRMERLPLNRLHWKLLGIHGMGPFFDGFDMQNINYILPALVAAFGLTAVETGTTATAAALGMMFGCFIVGPVADRFGRKAVFQLTLLIFSIFTGFCAFASGFIPLLIFRIIVGIGLGGELPVVAALMSEFLPAKDRGRLMPIYQSFYAWGQVFAAASVLLVLPIFGWRVAFFTGVLPALFVWVIRQFLPESPRWLTSRGKLDQAEKVMQRLERETERNLKMKLPELDMNSSPEQKLAPETPPRKVGFKDLFAGAYARRTAITFSYWFGLWLVSGSVWGIALMMVFLSTKFPLAQALWFGLIMTFASAPGYYVSAYLLDKIGRKPTIMAYSLLGALAYFLFPRATTIPEYIGLGLVMNAVTIGGIGSIFTYVSEQFPTHLRATGTAWASGLGRLGMFLGGPLSGLLIGALGWVNAYTTAAAILVVTSCLVLLGIETKGKSLEQLEAEAVRTTLACNIS